MSQFGKRPADTAAAQPRNQSFHMLDALKQTVPLGLFSGVVAYVEPVFEDGNFAQGHSGFRFS